MNNKTIPSTSTVVLSELSTTTVLPVLQLRLSLSSSGSDESEQSSTKSIRKGVRWDSEAVDNEGLGKKSSKKCCIFHKQRKFDDPYEDEKDKEKDDDEKEKGEENVELKKINESYDTTVDRSDESKKSKTSHSHSTCHDDTHDHTNSHTIITSQSTSIEGCKHCDRIKAIEEEARLRQQSRIFKK
jgi:protein phosphatase 1 regulatory subunit 11